MSVGLTLLVHAGCVAHMQQLPLHEPRCIISKRCSNIGSTNVPACACSFRGDLAARPRWAGRTLSWALDMANFENVPVQLTGFEMENSTMLWSVFMSEVGQNIKVCYHSFVR